MDRARNFEAIGPSFIKTGAPKPYFATVLRVACCGKSHVGQVHQKLCEQGNSKLDINPMFNNAASGGYAKSGAESIIFKSGSSYPP